MNTEKSHSVNIPLRLRTIESPFAIEARAKAISMIERAIKDKDSALAVLEELQQEVDELTFIDKPDQEYRPDPSRILVGASHPQDTRLRFYQTIDELKSIADQLHESPNENLTWFIYRLEVLIMSIESTKSAQSPESEPSSDIYELQGENIELAKIGAVFNPSPHGLFLGENIHINPGESFMDIGTGSGLFAILASRKGATASATEVSREAVEITKFNAAINKVVVDAKLVDPEGGSFFAGFSGNFDVLVANLPQKMVLTKNGEQKKFDAQMQGVYGGNSGNEILISFLEEAREHMHQDSRLYIQVYSLTNHRETLENISKYYEINKLASREFVEDDLINQNREAYDELKQRGVIDFTERDGHLYTTETAYELKLKKAK